jgi:hypothetical protein
MVSVRSQVFGLSLFLSKQKLLRFLSMPASDSQLEERQGVRILRLRSDDGINRLTPDDPVAEAVSRLAR